jgi:hypothetical protein
MVAALMVSGTSARSETRVVSLSSVKSIDLVELCERSQSGQGVQLDPCAAYILGAADALSVAGRFCNSGNAWTIQAVAVARRYISEHPEKWGAHPYSLVEAALSQAFPCARRSGDKR